VTIYAEVVNYNAVMSGEGCVEVTAIRWKENLFPKSCYPPIRTDGVYIIQKST